MNNTTPPDYIVTVCDSCLRACCWHGLFMCDASRDAGTKELRASEVAKLDLEHHDYFSREQLLEVEGRVRDV
jgi:hypothetical protein